MVDKFNHLSPQYYSSSTVEPLVGDLIPDLSLTCRGCPLRLDIDNGSSAIKAMETCFKLDRNVDKNNPDQRIRAIIISGWMEAAGLVDNVEVTRVATVRIAEAKRPFGVNDTPPAMAAMACSAIRGCSGPSILGDGSKKCGSGIVAETAYEVGDNSYLIQDPDLAFEPKPARQSGPKRTRTGKQRRQSRT